MKIHEINQAVKPTMAKFMDSIYLSMVMFAVYIVAICVDHTPTSWDFIVASGSAAGGVIFVLLLRWVSYILTK